MTYPTDSMGRKCTLDNPKFNYLYFTNINDHVHKSIVIDKTFMFGFFKSHYLINQQTNLNQI